MRFIGMSPIVFTIALAFAFSGVDPAATADRWPVRPCLRCTGTFS